MPVNMPAGLLAPEAEDIQPLAGHHLFDRHPDSADHRLDRGVLGCGEVIQNALAVLLGRHQDIAVQGRILVKEGDVLVVFVDDMMSKVRIGSHEFADEAAAAYLSVKGGPVHLPAPGRAMSQSTFHSTT